MPESAISPEQYGSLVRERVLALRSLLGDLTRGAPQSAPSRFFCCVRTLIDAIEATFASRCSDIESQSVPEAEKTNRIAFTASLAMRLLSDVQEELFPFLDKLDSPHVPLAILPAMQHTANEFHCDAELYLFPTSEQNFGFSGFRNLLETFIQKFELIIPDDLKTKLKEKGKMLPRWFVFLSFPYPLHNSALHLTPLLHELGHFADFQLEIYKELLPIDISQNEAARSLVEEISKTKIPVTEAQPNAGMRQHDPTEPTLEQIIQKEVIEQQVFEQCGEIVRNWVHEIVSDLFAVRTAGPAYFYAFAVFAVTIGLDAKAAETHPSPAVRIKFMLDELKQLHYSSEYSLPEVRSSVELWERWTEAQRLEPDAGPVRVAYLVIMENAARLAEAVRKKITLPTYGTKIFRENVPSVTRELESGVPPIDRATQREGVFEPCSFVDILNGAWLTYMFSSDKLGELLDCPSEERKLRAVNVLNELTMKAIEASGILRECQKQSSPRQ